MVLQLNFEVKQRIFVVNLYDSGCGLAGIHPYALLDAQHVERIDLSLRMANDGASAVSAEQIIDPCMFAPDHFLEMAVSQLADDLKEEHKLISQRKPRSLSGLLKGSEEDLSGLFGILDEEHIIAACSFQQIPHLILLEF